MTNLPDVLVLLKLLKFNNMYISMNRYGYVALTNNKTAELVTWINPATGETHKDTQSSLWLEETYLQSGVMHTTRIHRGWTKLNPGNIRSLGFSIKTLSKAIPISSSEGKIVIKVINNLLSA